MRSAFSKVASRQVGIGLEQDGETIRIAVGPTSPFDFDPTTGALILRTGGGVTVAPGSPPMVQVARGDDSLAVKNGALLARPHAKHTRTNFGTLQFVLDTLMPSGKVMLAAAVLPLGRGVGMVLAGTDSGVTTDKGTVVLVAGAATISSTKITANSLLFLSVKQFAGVPGLVGENYAARVAGTSLAVVSQSNLDTSTLFWRIEEP